MIRTMLPTPEQTERAETFYDHGALHNSITRGQSNIYGALGEVLFGDAYPQWRKVESYNHDFEDAHGHTVDIKTKRTTTPPQPNHLVSVALTSEHQHPDYYFFVRIMEDFSRAWILGWIPYADFYEQAEFGAAGELDTGSKTGYRFPADCRNMEVSQLRAASQPAC